MCVQQFVAGFVRNRKQEFVAGFVRNRKQEFVAGFVKNRKQEFVAGFVKNRKRGSWLVGSSGFLQTQLRQGYTSGLYVRIIRESFIVVSSFRFAKPFGAALWLA